MINGIFRQISGVFSGLKKCLREKKDCRRKFESAFLKMEKLAGVCALIFSRLASFFQATSFPSFWERSFFISVTNGGMRIAGMRASRGADETRLLCALELKGFRARGIVFRFLRHGFAR